MKREWNAFWSEAEKPDEEVENNKNGFYYLRFSEKNGKEGSHHESIKTLSFRNNRSRKKLEISHLQHDFECELWVARDSSFSLSTKDLSCRLVEYKYELVKSLTECDHASSSVIASVCRQL